MYTYILMTMLITDQYNQLAAFYCIKKKVLQVLIHWNFIVI